jgi:Fe-S-cluster containining protein
MDLDQFRRKATALAPENRKFLHRLAKQNPRQVDEAFHAAHEAIFAETHCLSCANCCKTTSPIFYPADIGRAAKALRMRPGDFIEKFLRTDEDNDFVLRAAPCPFLGADNLCSIYDDRPRACREYPHTNRRKMVQIMELTYQNTLVCPAVLQMVEKLKALTD